MTAKNNQNMPVPHEDGRRRLAGNKYKGASMTASTLFWQRLTEAERAAMRRVGRTRGFPSKTALLTQGNRSDSAVVLLKGSARVEAVSEDGRTTILGLREAGDLVGWQSAIDGGTCVATVTTIRPATVLIVSWSVFVGLTREYPLLSEALLNTISNRLREADQSRIQFAGAEVTARLASVILNLLSYSGNPTAGGVELRGFSQEDLGRIVAASRESVSRSLNSLRRDGVVRTGRMRITVTDVVALRNLCER